MGNALPYCAIDEFTGILKYLDRFEKLFLETVQ